MRHGLEEELAGGGIPSPLPLEHSLRVGGNAAAKVLRPGWVSAVPAAPHFDCHRHFHDPHNEVHLEAAFAPIIDFAHGFTCGRCIGHVCADR